MWYLSWILGTGFALAFGILNAMWLEVLEPPEGEGLPSGEADTEQQP